MMMLGADVFSQKLPDKVMTRAMARSAARVRVRDEDGVRTDEAAVESCYIDR